MPESSMALIFSRVPYFVSPAIAWVSIASGCVHARGEKHRLVLLLDLSCQPPFHHPLGTFSSRYGRFCDSCEMASSFFTFEPVPSFITSLGFPCSYACVTGHRVLFIGLECERLRRKTIQMELTDLDKHFAFLYIKQCLNHCLIR